MKEPEARHRQDFVTRALLHVQNPVPVLQATGKNHVFRDLTAETGEGTFTECALLPSLSHTRIIGVSFKTLLVPSITTTHLNLHRLSSRHGHDSDTVIALHLISEITAHHVFFLWN